MKTRFTISFLLLFSMAFFAVEVSEIGQRSYWERSCRNLVLDESVIDIAIEGLRAYYLNNQTVRGDFNYEVNVSSGEITNKRNSAHEQAEALLALSQLVRVRNTEPTRRSLVGAFDFYIRNRCSAGKDANLVFTIVDTETIKTDAVALFGLALSDFIDSQGNDLPEAIKSRFLEVVEEQLKFLISAKLEKGWGAEYDISKDFLLPANSPVSDALVLAFYCRMARQYGHVELQNVIEQELERQIGEYIIDGMKYGADLSVLRNSYHSIAYMLSEYISYGGEHKNLAKDAISGLAWYMIYRDHLAISESSSGRIALGILLASKAQAPDGEEWKAMRQFALNLSSEILKRQVMGPGWNIMPDEIVNENCAGGVMARRDGKNIRLGDCNILLQILLGL